MQATYLVRDQVIVNALKYGILNASAIWYPAIALGLSMSTSVSWQASQDVFNKSSIQPRNYNHHQSSAHADKGVKKRTLATPSLKNDTVNVPFSTHIRINSAGSPPTYPNSIPYDSTHP